ncbi:Conserved oligomeric Golgi complex subunit 5, partial [Cucurbita argyrosperma subsp. argyrosperma]
MSKYKVGKVLLLLAERTECRHASLVRPLSESGELRMARDMAGLQLAVGQNLFPVEQLGAPYQALHAFRPLIFLETSQLEASPLLHGEDQAWKGIKATLNDYAAKVKTRETRNLAQYTLSNQRGMHPYEHPPLLKGETLLAHWQRRNLGGEVRFKLSHCFFIFKVLYN